LENIKGMLSHTSIKQGNSREKEVLSEGNPINKEKKKLSFSSNSPNWEFATSGVAESTSQLSFVQEPLPCSVVSWCLEVAKTGASDDEP
jgi:hypothetical protein